MDATKTKRFCLLSSVLMVAIVLYIATALMDNNNRSERLYQLLHIDTVGTRMSFLKHAYLYGVIKNKFNRLTEVLEPTKKTCKSTMSSKEVGQNNSIGEPLTSFLHNYISQNQSQSSKNTTLSRIVTLIKIFQDLETLENCQSPAQKEWSLRLSSPDCQARRPRDQKNRSFYHAQVYHNEQGWTTLHLFSTGIAVQGKQRPNDLGKCDLVIGQVLPSLYESPFRTELAETNAIIALGLLGKCLPKTKKEVDWISTGSWKSNKLPAPCDHLRQLDLLRITSILAEQTKTTDTIDGIFWNRVLGGTWHVTEGHLSMRPLMTRFFKDVFGIEVPNNTTVPQRKEWLFYGLTLPCCSHFALRRNAFKTLAKLHVISLVYMIIHYGGPHSCPWPSGIHDAPRCWSFFNERLTAPFIGLLTNYVDITDIKKCDNVYNMTFVNHPAIKEFRAALPNVAALFTAERIDEIYNRMKCELYSFRV